MNNSNKIWFKRWWGVLIIIISAIILFFLALSASYFIGEIKNAKLKSSQTSQTQTGQNLGGSKYDAAVGDHYWLGSANAKITIVEFGDFACPSCLSAYHAIGEISAKYKNDIKFIWRDYPIIAEYSTDLALAARCAGDPPVSGSGNDQNLFWRMHDKLFQNQAAIASLAVQYSADPTQFNEQLTNLLVSLANQVGADPVKFKACLNQQKYLPGIQKDLADGKNFGITGTPTYFIDGYKLAGDVPVEVFTKMIEQLKK